ncbi:MAG: hypothetical protein EBU26_02315 [Verrucomicrobia bacterium]|nr:hypothetical protein [Verrucomicrobiota bacterium]
MGSEPAKKIGPLTTSPGIHCMNLPTKTFMSWHLCWSAIADPALLGPWQDIGNEPLIGHSVHA